MRDRTIEFDDLTEKVAMGTFEISIPHFFEKATKEDHLNSPRKDRKRHEDQPPGRRVENNDQPEEFKMKPNEEWELFRGKQNSPPPQINGCTMCKRWHTRGYCFRDCPQADSHVPGSEISKEMNQKYCKFLQQLRKAND